MRSLKVFTLSTFLLTNIAFSEDKVKYYDYKVSGQTYVTAGTAGLSLLTFGLAYTGRKNEPLSESVLVVISGAVMLSALLNGSIVTTNGTMEINSKKTLNDYKRIKYQVRSSLATGIAPSDKDLQTLVKSLACTDCESEAQKVFLLKNVIDKVERKAYEIASKVDFDRNKVQELVNEIDFKEVTQKILDESKVKYSAEATERLLALAIYDQTIRE